MVDSRFQRGCADEQRVRAANRQWLHVYQVLGCRHAAGDTGGLGPTRAPMQSQGDHDEDDCRNGNPG
jgi:hypothetical protein